MLKTVWARAVFLLAILFGNQANVGHHFFIYKASEAYPVIAGDLTDGFGDFMTQLHLKDIALEMRKSTISTECQIW